MGERFKVSRWGDEWRVLSEGRVMVSFRGLDAKARAEARARDYEAYLCDIERRGEEDGGATDADDGE